MVEANINADAEPAANAMRTVVIISCPAPFERLEAFAPTIGDRTIRKPYEKPDPRRGLVLLSSLRAPRKRRTRYPATCKTSGFRVRSLSDKIDIVNFAQSE